MDEHLISTEIFGKRLRQLRMENNLSQRDAASKLGITAASLSAYENGKQIPSIGVATRIATEFGETLDWLCGLRPDSERNQSVYAIRRTLQYITKFLDCGIMMPQIKTDGDSEWINELAIKMPLERFILTYSQVGAFRAQGVITPDSYNAIMSNQLDILALEIEQKWLSTLSDFDYTNDATSPTFKEKRLE